MRALTRRTALGALAAAPVACTSLGAAPKAGAGLGPMKRGVDLKADIGILRRAYTELHPGLYRYATPELAAARFDQLERDFGADQSLGQAYLTLSRFLATVRCGHSHANFFNQSDAVAAALFRRRSFLPFHFRWLGGQIVVERNLSEDASLTPGTVISHIDGIAAEEILATLLAYVRADGSNDDKRRALLEVRGFDRFETFDVFHSMAFPATDAAFDLRVRTPGGAARKVSIAAHGPDERQAAMRVRGEKDGPEWTFEMRGRVGVLTMPNWALYNSKWDWRGWLADRLDRLAGDGARGLIVDVRGNEGGLDCGDPIIARLIDLDLKRDEVERRVRYRRTPADLDPYLDTWDNSFRNWGEDAVAISDGWYKLKGESEDEPVIAAKGPRFTGKVVVLTDAQNSSATFQFAQKVQSFGLGQLVGQPTGGNQRGINGGAYFFLRLAGSGLEVDLPLIGYFPPNPMPDAGLTPDLQVDQAVGDIASGRDRAMETALSAF